MSRNSPQRSQMTEEKKGRWKGEKASEILNNMVNKMII